ncbi:MAG TPA: histidine phosphatase family protein [Trebonia sp.]|nr:histidine phosphatase family protein [Trebonia sp.]
MSTRSLPGTVPAPGLTRPALWLVRHGESTWNVAGLCQGHSDEAELTERGLRQAADAAAQFGYRPVRAIYASDLRRARQTAAAFAAVLGLPVQLDARLRERRLGVLEGTASRAISPSALGHGDGRLAGPDTRPAGGESVRDLYLRAAGFCDDLAAGLRDRRDTLPGLTGRNGDVLVIAHGGTVRVLAAYLSGVPVDQMAWQPVDNATCLRVPCPSIGGNR